MARLPNFHDDLNKLRQMEAGSILLQQSLQECQEQLKRSLWEEELAQTEMTKARETLRKKEAQVEQCMTAIQEHEAQQKELQNRAILEPHKVDRLRRVQHTGERLQEAKDFQRSVEIAKEEAKKTDVEAQRARKEVTSRIARVSEELRDAERHLHFITELRAQEFARLGEVEQQKRELLEVHRKGAVEHERMKCQLDALGSGQGPAELFDLPKSQRSSQFLTLQGMMFPCSSFHD
ncbi:unnamed protein product [Durusdinium trenchii]|uniref:Uncharacterized protein n=1 Tax=Durusdinium trenchii TaxID=1381693 RepID=A0ABP0JUJ4_9DINO